MVDLSMNHNPPRAPPGVEGGLESQPQNPQFCIDSRVPGLSARLQADGEITHAQRIA
jgi:hypothetical protein